MSIPPPPRRRPWAPVLAAVGAGLLVVAVALGVWVGRGFSEMVPAPSDIKSVAGDTVVAIDDGETLILYAPRRMMPTCDITGPTEQVPDIELGGDTYSFPVDGVSYESIAKIGGPGQPAGEYTVACVEDGLIVAPPLDVGHIVAVVFALLGVLAIGGLGVVAVVVGLVVWQMNRHRTA